MQNAFVQEIYYEFTAAPLQLRQLSAAGQVRGCADALLLAQVCSGSLALTADGQTRTLHTGQFALLGDLRFYHAESPVCTLLVLRLDTAALQAQFPQSFAQPFACFCRAAKTERLHQLFVQATQLAGQTQRPSALARQQLALTMLETVIASFGYAAPSTQDAKLQHLAQELRHCAVHFRQPLSPVDAAKRCFLSLPYFSKLFRQEVGLSYSEYVTQLRLNAAVSVLEHTKMPLHQIAEECGFANARSFSAAFKAQFGHLPSQHTHAAAPSGRLPAPFLPTPQAEGTLPLLRLQPPAIDCTTATAPLAHGFCDTLPLGNAFELLFAARQQQLRRLVPYGDFSNGVLHGLLDARLWQADADFAQLDAVLDFVLSLGLVPFLRLDAATNPSPDYASPATAAQIAQLLQHLVQRHGTHAVQQWQLAPAAFPERDFVDASAYFAGYRTLYRTAKAVCSWQVASPAFLPDTVQEANPWFAAFMGQCREYACLPDALCAGFCAALPDESLPTEALPSFLQRSMTALRRMGLPYATLQIEQYTLCHAHGDLLGDTPFHAAWLAKNLPEAAPMLAHFVPASLADTASAQPFDGMGGLLTAGGVPKAGCLALCLLGQLGRQQVAHGDGYILTQTEAGYAILLYNYCHPDTLAGAPTAPYARFRRRTRRQFALALCGLPNGSWQRTDLLLSQDSGSAYDAWLVMGGGGLSPDDNAYLQAIAQPKRHRAVLQAEGGRLDINETLAPFAVQLILLQQGEPPWKNPL